MSVNSKIEWCDATWNPVSGCSKISEGCKYCWAERMAYRLKRMGKSDYFSVVDKYRGQVCWTNKIKLRDKELDKPLHWRKPRRIFVCSMGDLFHEAVPFEFISKVFDVVRQNQQHIFLMLTKKPSRLLEMYKENPKKDWPISANLWLGVSVENQKRADERIPILLEIPAARRFVSIEPMLGPVDLQSPYDYFHPQKICDSCGKSILYGSAHEWYIDGQFYRCGKVIDYGTLDWVIVGCESGPKRRPCNLEWVRSLVRQCRAARVPVFVKQLSINGKVSTDMSEWPADLRVQERPE